MPHSRTDLTGRRLHRSLGLQHCQTIVSFSGRVRDIGVELRRVGSEQIVESVLGKQSGPPPTMLASSLPESTSRQLLELAQFHAIHEISLPYHRQMPVMPTFNPGSSSSSTELALGVT